LTDLFVVVVVDQEEVQMVDMDFDKDFLVVDRDFVENHYLLKENNN
jgi:hypothetical protein